MNIEFKAIAKKVAPVDEVSIVVDGQTFGFVEFNEYPSGRPSYMVRVVIFDGVEGRACGHGETKEKAVLSAIEKGRCDAQRLLAGLDDFERRISPDFCRA